MLAERSVTAGGARFLGPSCWRRCRKRSHLCVSSSFGFLLLGFRDDLGPGCVSMCCRRLRTACAAAALTAIGLGCVLPWKASLRRSSDTASGARPFGLRFTYATPVLGKKFPVVIESQWVSKVLAVAGRLRPQGLNAGAHHRDHCVLTPASAAAQWLKYVAVLSVVASMRTVVSQ
eukprot:SAG25_NODE_514_length_7279_cov_5.792758_7_plen_175_part_00